MTIGIIFRSFLISLVFSTAIFLSSCSDSNLGPAVTNSSVSYTSNNDGLTAGSLQIDSVKMLINGIKFGMDDPNTFTNFRTESYVLYLNMTGDVKLLADAYVPLGTYTKSRFEVHQLLTSETAPDPDFVDANGRYSIVVMGTYDGVQFKFKSQVNAEETLIFPASMTISADVITNATLRISPYRWFIMSGGGGYINPTIAANTALIDANISANAGPSFTMFKDTNKDGNPD